MFLHDGFGHETSHSCPHGKQPGEYCEPCNASAIASGIPLNAPMLPTIFLFLHFMLYAVIDFIKHFGR